MILSRDIYYLAGILEGEGCFSVHNRGRTPFFAVKISDKDIVEKVKCITGCKGMIQEPRDRSNILGAKKLYKIEVCGILAIQWMMTIYSLMGERRKKRIRELLNIWMLTKSRKVQRNWKG